MAEENHIKLISDPITRHSFSILVAALIFFVGKLLVRFLTNLPDELLVGAHTKKIATSQNT